MPKVVLITGGSSGIGKAIGEYLHARGFSVYGTSRNPEKYLDAVPFTLLALDVTKEETIIRGCELFGRERLVEMFSRLK